MTTASSALTGTWDAVLADAPEAPGSYHRRVPIKTHWPVHAGVHRPTCDRLLLLEIEATVASTSSIADVTKGYSIDVSAEAVGSGGRVAIVIREGNQAFQGVFTVFCADIVDHWVQHSSAAEAVKSLRSRLTRWKKFFQRGVHSGLSREEYVALYGELVLIERGLLAGVAGEALVNGWLGPRGANQDFMLGAVALEVKTVTGNEWDKVRINNIRQLDSTGVERLYLVRFAFDFREGSGRRLYELLAAVKAMLSATSSTALLLLEDRIMEAGLVPGQACEFDGWGFTLRDVSCFCIDDNFPRLLESALPCGISEVSYIVNLSAASAFKVNEGNVYAHI